jgi:hypothetical protein
MTSGRQHHSFSPEVIDAPTGARTSDVCGYPLCIISQRIVSGSTAKSQSSLSVLSPASRDNASMIPNLPKRVIRQWLGVKPLAALVGAAALITLAVLSATAGQPQHTPIELPQAGSGSAPMNTTFNQPVVGGMTLGGTATTTTPPTAPAVSMAVPAVKAGS